MYERHSYTSPPPTRKHKQLPVFTCGQTGASLLLHVQAPAREPGCATCANHIDKPNLLDWLSGLAHFPPLPCPHAIQMTLLTSSSNKTPRHAHIFGLCLTQSAVCTSVHRASSLCPAIQSAMYLCPSSAVYTSAPSAVYTSTHRLQCTPLHIVCSVHLCTSCLFSHCTASSPCLTRRKI